MRKKSALFALAAGHRGVRAVHDGGLPRAGTRQSARRVAVPERRRLGHALPARRPDQRGQLRQAQGGVDLPRRQLRPGAVHRTRVPRPATSTACSTRWPGSGAPWWPWTPRPARSCGPYREPHTTRWQRSMRAGYGKGVAYGEIDGRGVIYITTPGFFLHALDAKTGQPLENWGRPVPLPGFPKTGVVDLSTTSSSDWGPWQKWQAERQEVRPGHGHPARARLHHQLPRRPSSSTASWSWATPPSRATTRRASRTCPGDILGVRRTDREAPLEVPRDPAAGRVRPRDVGERRLVVHGRRLVVGPDVGRPRARHRLHPDEPADHRLLRRLPAGRQPVRHERHRARRQDRASASGTSRRSTTTSGTTTCRTCRSSRTCRSTASPFPAVIQTTKQGFIFTFNRVTGEPIWPIEERPVPQTTVPGNWTSPTQPFPTRPEPMEPLGLSENDLIDFTPELQAGSPGDRQEVPRWAGRTSRGCRKGTTPAS